MKQPKTIERNLYIEVKNTPEGQAILGQLAELLADLRQRKAYLNGWIGPFEEK